MATKAKALLGLFLILGSCNDEGKTSSDINEDSVNTVKTVIADTVSLGCYSQIADRDTSSLQIEGKGNTITGTLSYNIYQKDRSAGSIQAELSGDTTKGWYLFKSEGIVSVRQVAWKINGEELWPALGEMTQRNDTMIFVQLNNLKYDNTRPFKKVPCVI